VGAGGASSAALGRRRLTTEERMKRMIRKLRTFADEEGQGLVEYSLILVFVSIVSVGVLKVLGGDVASLLTAIAADI
jgi:Flp pilus assembly pilin Flp